MKYYKLCTSPESSEHGRSDVVTSYYFMPVLCPQSDNKLAEVLKVKVLPKKRRLNSEGRLAPLGYSD